MPDKKGPRAAEQKRRWYKENPKQVKICSWKAKHKLCSSNGNRLTKDEWGELYDKWVAATNCDCCGKVFEPPNNEGSRCYNDKQLDHDHKTLQFRNFLCNKCNKIRAYVDNDYLTIMKLMAM